MDLTEATALELVSSFFEKDWPQTKLQDVQLRKITGGLVNTLHLLTRSNKVQNEPSSVLIRHFGLEETIEEPPDSSMILTATEQALIYQEMARRGWGPQIHGTFPGGRLEEYIDSHPLTATESMDPIIRRDIARSYARLHSLDLPFRKRNIQRMISEFKPLIESRMDNAFQTLSTLPFPSGPKLASLLQQIDLGHELDWLARLFDENHCRPAIAVGDSNYLNILVKNYADPDCQVVLIDYETATYTYRGVDIGGHFNERQYDWGHTSSKLTGFAAHGVEERRAFCEAYLEEMRQLGQVLGEYDTVEHLLLEGEIGEMWQIVLSILMCVVFDEEVESEEMFVEGLVHVVETYQQLVKGSFER